MNVLLSPDVLVSSLWRNAFMLAFCIVGLLFYGYLADLVIFEGKGQVRAQFFGRADVVIAGGLIGLFLLLIGTHQGTDAVPSAADMVTGVIESTGVFTLLLAGIVGSLLARHISCREAFGFNRVGFAVVVCSAALLLVMAYPLIDRVQTASQWFMTLLGESDEVPQIIVRFLGSPKHHGARALVAFSAVVLAPLQEEFIFRGYIYGVIRRYAGVGAGIVFSAALFAGIHLHAASFGGLFVLAVCLTLAYEWTGSLLVPITIHALFNSLTVFSLLSGNGKV